MQHKKTLWQDLAQIIAKIFSQTVPLISNLTPVLQSNTHIFTAAIVPFLKGFSMEDQLQSLNRKTAIRSHESFQITDLNK